MRHTRTNCRRAVLSLMLAALLLPGCPTGGNETGASDAAGDDATSANDGTSGARGDTTDLGDAEIEWSGSLPGDASAPDFATGFWFVVPDNSSATAYGHVGASSLAPLGDGPSGSVSLVLTTYATPNPCQQFADWQLAQFEAGLKLGRDETQEAIDLVQPLEEKFPEDFWQFSLGVLVEDAEAPSGTASADDGHATATLIHHPEQLDWEYLYKNNVEIDSLTTFEPPGESGVVAEVSEPSEDRLRVEATVELQNLGANQDPDADPETGTVELTAELPRCPAAEEAFEERETP